MKILFLTNNENALPLANWLLEQDQQVVVMSEKLTEQELKEYDPQLIISFNYRYMIKPWAIQFMQGRVINLHTSLLPWNRGSSPNFWSFVENTPKGVTIHVIDETLDTGAILFQKELFFDESLETFATTYDCLIDAIIQLFKEHWTEIKDWQVKPYHREEEGSYHTMKDFNALCEGVDFSWSDKISETKRKLGVATEK